MTDLAAAAEKLKRLQRRADMLSARLNELHERQTHAAEELRRQTEALADSARGYEIEIADSGEVFALSLREQQENPRPGMTIKRYDRQRHLLPRLDGTGVLEARRRLAEVRQERDRLAAERGPLGALVAACKEELRARGWREPRP